MENTTISPTSPGSIIRSIILGFVALLAFSGNLLVCLTLYRRKYLLTPSNKLVFSLTVSNFIFSILVLPFVVVSSIQQYWVLGGVWCSLTGFITLTTVGASLFTLSLISFDRYYAITHPLQYPSVLTGFRITCMIIMSWILSGCCAIPPLFGAWSKYQFYSARMSCIPPWGFDKGFSVYWLVLFFCIPFCIMMVCYCCIFHLARSKTKQIPVNSSQGNKLFQPKINTLFVDDDENVFHDNQPSTTSAPYYSETIDKRCLQKNVLEENDKSIISYTKDSGMASDSLTERNFESTSNYFLNLPNQVSCSDEHDTVLAQNDSALYSISTNNSILNDHNLSTACNYQMVSNCNGKTNPQITSALVHSSDKHFVYHQTNSNNVLDSSNSRNSGCDKWKPPLIPKAYMQSKQICTTAVNQMQDTIVTSSFSQDTTHTRECISRISTRSSQAEHRPKLLTYSHNHYYGNPRKTLCTILCVTGILLITVGPFFVESWYEVFHGGIVLTSDGATYISVVPNWLISTVTTLLYFTCVYYPLIYGLWNRTVRKEIKAMLYCSSRGPQTRRTRILSLTTHFKDLGLSPRLTAAIMEEGAAVATFVRPMRVEAKTSKKNSVGILRKTSQHFRKKQQKREAIDVSKVENKSMAKSINACPAQRIEITSHNNLTTTKQSYQMRLKTEEERPISNFNTSNNIFRDREKPAKSLLKLNSDEVLRSDILRPALLFSNTETSQSVCFNKCSKDKRSLRSNNLNFASENDRSISSESLASNDFNSDSETVSVNGNVFNAISDCFSNESKDAEKPDTNPDKSMADTVSQLTEGKLRSSNLIHLEAGEPIRIRRWSKPQMFDYFAQTLAYTLVENVRE